LELTILIGLLFLKAKRRFILLQKQKAKAKFVEARN